MRLDVNVSLRPKGETLLNTKVDTNDPGIYCCVASSAEAFICITVQKRLPTRLVAISAAHVVYACDLTPLGSAIQLKAHQ